MTTSNLRIEKGTVQPGAELAETLKGSHYSYFNLEPDAEYRQISLSDDEAHVVGSHYESSSHVVNPGRVADVIMEIGMGVGDPTRPQHAIFISTDYPPQAVVFERIDP